jgi:UDPglucose 6-dehydrogenase
MKITVIGAGYVGLVSAICFYEIGHEVICVDNNQEKIDKLNNGLIPIYEPGLDEILSKPHQNQQISFTSNLAAAIEKSEAIFIAVGTPQDDITGDADLSFVYQAARDIALASKSYKIIITKSTVPAGTNQKIKQIIAKHNPNLEFSIVSNPEFLKQGAAVEDFLHPDRIIIGIEDGDDKAQNLMAKIYEPLKNAKIIYTDIASAELIKYAANSFLAIKIGFINEIANLCEKIGANILEVAKGIGLDPRIGPKFLNPGPGFGGSCFPKDILALASTAKQNNLKLSIIDAVISSNQTRKLAMVDKIIAACKNDVKDKTIAILGLAFKAGTDDIRCSPSIAIIAELIKRGAKINAYDQQAIKNCQKEIGNNSAINYFTSPYEASKNSDALVIATEWDEFRNLNLEKIKELQKTALIIDLRNMIDNKKAKDFGFDYFGIGVTKTS